MIAFEVLRNGKKLCLAGVGSEGVLSAIADHVIGNERNRLHLSVGGLVLPRNEHVLWRKMRLAPGDEITIKIVEVDSVDRPRLRKRRNPSEEKKLLKKYIRTTAKQFGWQIVTRPRKIK